MFLTLLCWFKHGRSLIFVDANILLQTSSTNLHKFISGHRRQRYCSYSPEVTNCSDLGIQRTLTRQLDRYVVCNFGVDLALLAVIFGVVEPVSSAFVQWPNPTGCLRKLLPVIIKTLY